MGDMAKETPVFEGAFPIADSDKTDVAYHIAAQCGGQELHQACEEALDLARMLAIGPAHFEAARQEIRDHAAGQCPPGGHHGRACRLSI